MKFNHLFAGAAALSLLAGPTGAAEKAEKLGSVYVQCDGKAAHMSAGEAVGSILAITLTAGIVGGLVGAAELDDESKRIEGEPGITACTEALKLETEPLRRVELTLARAIHKVETGDYDAALVDIRSVDTVAGAKNDEVYRRGLGLSARHVEAGVLVWQGKPEEAAEVALKSAAQSPYDILNIMQTATFVGLTPEMTPAKRAYFDNIVRLWPDALLRRAVANEWAEDFAGAAADYQAAYDVTQGFAAKKDAVLPTLLARIAINQSLAGDLEKGAASAKRSREALETLMSGGQAAASAAAISQTEEILDLQTIAERLTAGDVDGARATFAARGRWVEPNAPVIAFITRKLQAGAAPAQLTGALARSPDTIREEGLRIRMKAITEQPAKAKALFDDIYNNGAAPSAAVTKAVWKVDKSTILAKRDAKSTYVGDILSFSDYLGPPATGEAVLLHAALLARKNGQPSFVIAPGRSRINTIRVRYGKSGDEGIPAIAALDAETVITDLSVKMPKPTP